ncbi:MAG: hypothetical protein NTV06_01955 [candidate division Zixibacteria bacterium]|nr:hypothetical protein [candidate division Zixibacteria bacterium]
MRIILMVSAIYFLVTFSVFGHYSEKRTLLIPSGNIEEFNIDCGAGSLEIRGYENLDKIELEAEIILDGLNRKDAIKYMEKYMNLELKERGSNARLTANFKDDNHNIWSLFGHSESREINLKVKIPKNMMLDISDGSGAMTIEDINAGIKISDGSGEIFIRQIGGQLEIEDGSGEIDIFKITGNIVISDGSGSVNIKDVVGDIDIDDGSGEIVVKSVDGTVTVSDGSGDIVIDDIRHDVDIESDGSGSTEITRVDGHVTRDDDYVNHRRRHY